MAIAYAIDEIRKDAHELTKIAIEDNISKTQVINMLHPLKLGSVNHWSMEKIIEDVKQYSSKYYRRPNDLNMLARSITILYDDQKQSTDKTI